MELIWNKADCFVKFEDVVIYAAPKGHASFSYQAIVEEQDTHLLLQQQDFLSDPGKPAWYLANILEGEKSQFLGEVLVRGKMPSRLLAIIHDIEQSPTYNLNSIILAYRNILILVAEKGISSLALPLLGTVHGKLAITDSIKLLRNALQKNLPACLQRIWLILPEGIDCRCLNLLSKEKRQK